jgi:hypothetical protein
MRKRGGARRRAYYRLVRQALRKDRIQTDPLPENRLGELNTDLCVAFRQVTRQPRTGALSSTRSNVSGIPM